MASKKNKLKKRKQDFTRRNSKVKLLQIDNFVVKFNKNNDIVYNDLINFKKENNSILNIKDDIDFLINEYNSNKNNLTKEQKNDIIKDINMNVKAIRNIKKIQSKIKNTSKTKTIKISQKSNVNENDVITYLRLKGNKGVYNTFNVDNEIRKIANLLNINFDECLNLIFPHFEENTSYIELIQKTKEAQITFEEYINNLKNSNEINEEIYENILMCLYNIYNL